MTTSSIYHRFAPYAVAATGLVGILVATTLTNAVAMPAPDDPSTVPVRTFQTTVLDLERSCFVVPLSWNQALEGPLPRCHITAR